MPAKLGPPRRRPAPRPSFRPVLESLEDRETPSGLSPVQQLQNDAIHVLSDALRFAPAVTLSADLRAIQQDVSQLANSLSQQDAALLALSAHQVAFAGAVVSVSNSSVAAVETALQGHIQHVAQHLTALTNALASAAQQLLHHPV